MRPLLWQIACLVLCAIGFALSPSTASAGGHCHSHGCCRCAEPPRGPILQAFALRFRTVDDEDDEDASEEDDQSEEAATEGCDDEEAAEEDDNCDEEASEEAPTPPASATRRSLSDKVDELVTQMKRIRSELQLLQSDVGNLADHLDTTSGDEGDLAPVAPVTPVRDTEA